MVKLLLKLFILNCGYDVREDMQCRTWTDDMIECKVINTKLTDNFEI